MAQRYNFFFKSDIETLLYSYAHNKGLSFDRY